MNDKVLQAGSRIDPPVNPIAASNSHMARMTSKLVWYAVAVADLAAWISAVVSSWQSLS